MNHCKLERTELSPGEAVSFCAPCDVRELVFVPGLRGSRLVLTFCRTGGLAVRVRLAEKARCLWASSSRCRAL